MKKLTIKILIILILLSSVVAYGYFEYKKNQKINPDIFPAFRKIENYCLEYVNKQIVEPLEYEKCSKLVSVWENTAKQQDDKPDAEEWYEIVQRLGFEQPALYLSQPATQEKYNQAMEEQKQLKEIQNKIIEKQLSEFIEEAKNSIRDK